MTAISLSCWSESDQKAIREQLVRILNSGPFHQSQRRQRFLEYLVNETLAGRGERLKAYNVALEVFDRPETFDPAIDPLVRIEAARLRDSRILRNRRPRRCHSHRPTEGLIHTANRVSTAYNTRSSARSTERDNCRTLARPCCLSAPISQDACRIPRRHNCSFVCTARRFHRLAVVGSIRAII